MPYDWSLFFCLFLALWSAILGGVFSAFSEFIMSALQRTTPEGGIEAMQHINRTVIPTQFVAGILLITVFSIVFAIYAAIAFEGLPRTLLILAAAVYVPSVFLMTILGNVPMNNRLDRFQHTTKEAKEYWQTYTRVWTRLNHVRTIGSIVTAGLYLIAGVVLISSTQV